MMGPIADSMPMSPTVRERHEKLRAAKFREVVEDGAIYGQPHEDMNRAEQEVIDLLRGDADL
jgi:hypothetical protein